jgi:hypothetical protein
MESPAAAYISELNVNVCKSATLQETKLLLQARTHNGPDGKKPYHLKPGASFVRKGLAYE